MQFKFRENLARREIRANRRNGIKAPNAPVFIGRARSETRMLRKLKSPSEKIHDKAPSQSAFPQRQFIQRHQFEARRIAV